MKIAAMCESHYVGVVPHFTGPIATAALTHVCGTFAGPVLMEMTGDGKRDLPHLPEYFQFRDGKLWPSNSPGLGVQIDTRERELMLEVSKPRQPVPLFRRDDGSITNW